ncbi:General transcription factor IIH subunit 2 [Porphyridium purpureum]|uniref:General transcription factor IIH subunit n=1 Tax=Porphyridium purpureum TaxID=35688 RepID=A0A5J4YXZ9_PORPP|nr:General transcription factor IIH subunit 2 [Porphyridium purpureum]|eukprot:POR3773..scf209_3
MGSKEYAWEANFERSWDKIQEDPQTGRLSASEGIAQQLARKRRRDSLRETLRGKVRRGMMRFMVLALDFSRSMNLTDMRPSRAEVVVGAAQLFVREFYDQNPISQLIIIATRNGVATVLSPLGSNPVAHIKALSDSLAVGTFGEASLQNLLVQGLAILDALPLYASREILVVFGSIATCDPGDVHATIGELREKKITVSIVCVAGAEVYVLKSASHETGGKHFVPMNEEHLHLHMQMFLQPPQVRADTLAPSLIRMGFPVLRTITSDLPPKKCLNDLIERRVGYECPRCSAWLSDVPIECVLCGLTLLSSPHLARSYHHLFPVPRFTEKSVSGAAEADQQRACSACLRSLAAGGESVAAECPRCSEEFCIECDSFIHESLHNCPGCENGGIFMYE